MDALLIIIFCGAALYLGALTIQARRRSIERRLSRLEQQARQKR